MINSSDMLLEAEARRVFQRLLRVGKRRNSFLARLFNSDQRILSLKTLLDLVAPESERYGGIEDVPVRKIIGTEGRSKDFAEGFYPRNDWMMPRWSKIYRLMMSKGISEPLQLIEYGGYYFVRDGNHRVSVAQHNGIAYLTAEVTHYSLPIHLPSYLNYRNLELFTEKYKLHQRTNLFEYVDDLMFHVHDPKTWKVLEKEIYVYSRDWFIRHEGRQPMDDAELIDSWKSFYQISAEHIQQRALLFLFPGLRETDVFVKIVTYWNSYDNPDQLWVGKVYEKFEEEQRRKHFIRSIFLSLKQQFQMWSSSPQDLKRFFYRSTRIIDIVPEFRPPVANKAFYLLCYRQIYNIYATHWQKKEKEPPGLAEIVRTWYDRFYQPLISHYKKVLYSIPFGHYYKRFSKKYFEDVITGEKTVEDCMAEYAAKLE